MGFIIFGMIIIGVMLSAAVIAGVLYFLAFVLRYLDYNTSAADFFNVENVFGWIVIIIGFLITVAIVGYIVKLISGLVSIPGMIIFASAFSQWQKQSGIKPVIIGTIGGLWITAIWGSMVFAIGYTTHLFMNYAAQNPELSEFYAQGSTISYVLAFLVFATVLGQSSSKSK